MSEPDPSIEIVQQVVQALHDRGAAVRASADALKRLAQTERSRPSTRAVPPPSGKPPASAPVSQSKPNLKEMFADATQRPNGDSISRASVEAPSTVSHQSPPPTPATSRTKEPTNAAEISGSKAERLAALRERVLPCQLCPNLVNSRTQVVFGVGNPEAELMFVGEAPGADEDLAGEPFVGKAGQLLTKIIETMGFKREDVYIANVLKCRPDMPPGESGNRKPTHPEMNRCKPYLLEQIEIIKPRVLVGLGATAMEGLLGVDKFPITKNRGRWQEFAGIPLMPTFHPAYLLRNQALSEKRRVWEDMLAVLEKLGRPISEKQRSYFLSK